MHLFLLGVSHRTAPVDLRERLDFSSRDQGAAVQAVAARPSLHESVVLSTCNRSEIYVASDDPVKAREELIQFLSEYHGIAPESFLPRLPWNFGVRRVGREVGGLALTGSLVPAPDEQAFFKIEIPVLHDRGILPILENPFFAA